MLIAMAVRNALEQIHGGGNLLDHREDGGTDEGLTDVQMRHINPIVRNAVATALYAMDNQATDRSCASYVAFQSMLIPHYWEQPELGDDLSPPRPEDSVVGEGKLSWLLPSATEEADCAGCGKRIILSGDRWLHTDADASRGCRAAMFVPEGDNTAWFEARGNRQMARPVRGTQRPMK